MNERFPETAGTADEAPSWFLLFGGLRQEAVGGLRSLRGVFASEDEARSAFRRLRLQRPTAASWGELVALDQSGRVRALCWFGVPSQAMAAHPAGSVPGTEAPGTTTDVPSVSAAGSIRRWLAKGSPPGGPAARLRAGVSP